MPGTHAPSILAHTIARVLSPIATILLVLAAALIALPATAGAATATFVSSTTHGPRHTQITVRSPAMDRDVRLDVLHPQDPSTAAARPTLYVLDGNGGNFDQPFSSWIMRTDIKAFFAKKNVNVVLPVGGGGTFYTDWQRDDPVLGRNLWETFLTTELPPLLTSMFNSKTAPYAVAGVSMGAQAATTLTVRNPGMFTALAAYSGCMYSSSLGQATVRTVVLSRGGNPDNMWGGPADPDWPAHDPFTLAAKLKGKPVYVFTGRGVPGRADINFDPSYSYPVDLASAIALEQVINGCTVLFQARLKQAGVKATFRYTTVATHSWPYWQKAFKDSWPTLRSGLGW